MKRTLLIGGAVLVVGAAVVLWVLLRRHPAGASEGGSDTAAADDEAGGGLGGPGAPRRGGFRPRTAADSPHIDTTKESEHANGIDRKYGQLLPMLQATGDGPCDTAYNAMQAEREAAQKLGRKTIFTFIADRGEFMKQCDALPEGVRKCMVPLYTTQHREECAPLKPPRDVLDKMFISRKDDFEEAKEPLDTPPNGPGSPEAPPAP